MPFLTNDPLPQCLQHNSATGGLLGRDHARGCRRYLLKVKCLENFRTTYFCAAIDCYKVLCDPRQYFLASMGWIGRYVRKDKSNQRLAGARSFAPRTRDVPQPLQQLLEEALGRLGAAPALHQDVEHRAVLVDRPPEVVDLAADADEDLVQVPLVTRPRPPLLERVGERPPEAQGPSADALVAHDDAALGQDRLDLAQAQAEAVVEPHGVADDLGREAEAAVRVGRRPHVRHPAMPL